MVKVATAMKNLQNQFVDQQNKTSLVNNLKTVNEIEKKDERDKITMKGQKWVVFSRCSLLH